MWLAEARWDHTAGLVVALGGEGVNPYRSAAAGPTRTREQLEEETFRQMEAFAKHFG